MSWKIPDSERFTEILDPVVSKEPGRPQKSSARGLEIYTPWESKQHEQNLNGRDDNSRKGSIASTVSPLLEVVEDGDDNTTQRFYSPVLTAGVLHHDIDFLDSKGDSRISDIPVAPTRYIAREAGVKRAFRSNIGTDGSISLSLLPTAAALSEMLGHPPSGDLKTSHPSLSPQGHPSLHDPVSDDHPSVEQQRKASVTSIGSRSSSTKPLTIRRKKPAVYNPEEDDLPVSRKASIDGVSLLDNFNNASPENSPPRRLPSALPVSHTYQTPLRPNRGPPIAESGTPPSTPPTWRESTHSGSNTEEESLPLSPQSTAPKGNSNYEPAMHPRKLDYGDPPLLGSLPPVPTRSSARESNRDIQDGFVPFACPIDEMQDKPGMVRRDSDDLTDIDHEDDDESVQDLGLGDFPVPSAILASAGNTPVVANFPASPTFGNSVFRTPRVGSAEPAVQAVRGSTATREEQQQSRPVLYSIPTDANGIREWDQATELAIRDRVFRAELQKPSKADKQRRKHLQKFFDQLKRPTKMEMYEASLLSVRDENGHKVRFGSLFEDKRTIVCFIRHFWCSQCQDYMHAIQKVQPAILEKHDMRFVVISNGSWKMIKGYRRLLGDKCPYEIYTDRGKYVYTALGMTLRTWDAGKQAEIGNYIQHSLGGSIIAGVAAGVKLPMKPPGDQQQLGGEFILGPGLEVHFCHRMKTTRGHADIEDVFASVGIDLDEETRALGLRSENQTPVGGKSSSSRGILNRLSGPRVSSTSPQSMSSRGVTANGQHQQTHTRKSSQRLKKKNPNNRKSGISSSSGISSPISNGSSSMNNIEEGPDTPKLTGLGFGKWRSPRADKRLSSATTTSQIGRSDSPSIILPQEDPITLDNESGSSSRQRQSSTSLLPTPDKASPMSLSFLQVPTPTTSQSQTQLGLPKRRSTGASITSPLNVPRSSSTETSQVTQQQQQKGEIDPTEEEADFVTARSYSIPPTTPGSIRDARWRDSAYFNNDNDDEDDDLVEDREAAVSPDTRSRFSESSEDEQDGRSSRSGARTRVNSGATFGIQGDRRSGASSLFANGSTGGGRNLLKSLKLRDSSSSLRKTVSITSQ